MEAAGVTDTTSDAAFFLALTRTFPRSTSGDGSSRNAASTSSSPPPPSSRAASRCFLPFLASCAQTSCHLIAIERPRTFAQT